jgi:hypothetical protein
MGWQRPPEAAAEDGPNALERRRIRPLRLLLAVLVGVAIALGLTWLTIGRQTWRTTPLYDPPVLAGQLAPGHCSGGFYARHGSEIVLTTSAHCGDEGQTVSAPDGSLYGVIGPAARLTPCPRPGRICAGSDMNYMVIAPRFLPWGHLNEVDMGVGGYRVIALETKPLSCADVAVGDRVEVNGRLRFRDGSVLQKAENDFAGDTYFPCIVATSISANIGDSGGAVLVRGLPAGISAREFGDHLAFTPLADGLTELGLELCTTPNCGLTPPASSAESAPPR